jgi:GNAT superfamily N-acetyltransferase
VSTQVAIRDYAPADEAPVLGLLNLTLGGGRAFERSTAFFRWKHIENPFGPSLMLLADGKEIVGLRAFLRWQFRVGGATSQAVRAVDTATHPGYQRMGIFSRLTTACLERARAEGVQFVFNTPNRFSMPGYLKLGWTYVGRSTIMIRPMRPLRMAKSFFTSSRSTPAVSQDGDRRENDPVRAVDELLTAEESLAGLLARDDASLVSGIRTARSVAYLRWRYARVPSMRYGAHWVGDGDLRAAAIYRITLRRGLRELMICELFCEDRRAGRRVIRELLGTVPADYAAAHCAASTPHRRVFLATGFVPAPRVGPHFTVRPLLPGPDGCDPRVAASWRLSLGDLEIF